MSAIARVMLDMGYRVSGSDVSSPELATRLQERGAKVFIGHSPAQVEGADMVVYSTAVPTDNVELEAARARQIPVLHRSEMLARLMADRTGIAVAGAHGKTTTTSMIAYVMERCGVDPTFVIGGVVSNIGDNAKAGAGQFVVAEADESDGSFLHYRPQIAVVTAIEADHLEYYDGKFENLKAAYAEFVRHIPADGLCIISAEDEHLRDIRGEAACQVFTFGIDAEADYMAKQVELLDRGSRSDIYFQGQRLGTLTLTVPGRHNIMNALAAIAVCRHAGLAFDEIVRELASFHGAKRRFQVISEVGDVLIIDDYAHHPTEISATIAAATTTGRRIVAVFQPQRYTRTYFLFDAFARAFRGADEVIIVDIYSPPGERQIEGVTAERLAEQIRVQSNPNVKFLRTKDDVFRYLLHTCRPGDLILTMGAGDIWQVAVRLGDALQDNQEHATM
jgi:UDP-N-acetylmuramate--alanine ligase